jgi:hypothetical protein
MSTIAPVDRPQNLLFRRGSATKAAMTQEISDFRIARLQRYIHRRQQEGRPAPSAYAPIEHDLREENIRAWLEQSDRKMETIKAAIRHVASLPDDTEFTA